MKKGNRFFWICWIWGLILLLTFPAGGETEPEEEKTIQDIEWTLKSMSVLENRFQLDVLFAREWDTLKKQLIRLKSRIGNEITGDNINTARQQFEFLRAEIDGLLKKREEIQFQLFSGLRLMVMDFRCADIFVMQFFFASGHSILSISRPVIPVIDEISCPEDESKYQRAVISETNSGLYQPGSQRYSQHLAEAIRLFAEVSESECLPENNNMKSYARFYIQQKKEELEMLVKKVKQGNLNPAEKQRLLDTVFTEELSVLGKVDPAWLTELGVDPATLKRLREMEEALRQPGPTEGRKSRETSQPETVPREIEPVITDRITGIPPVSEIVPESVHAITLDVWQSAWGTFTDLGVLLAYLRKNRIKKINLNPGLPMGPKFYREGYEKLKPLVDQFYQAGIQHIGFLYAELNYPIEFYAKFLRQYPDLNINTLVDDSEFVDMFSNRFEQNVRDVKKYGIHYSAFVTLETEGNSGVSDQTRFWVLDHVDYPILMSYFGCTLEEQKSKLEKYLSHADQRGIRRRVGIAILMGSKKIGREVSCERLLNEHQMKAFLRQLHIWAWNNHPSYGGIVLETNLKMPRMDVHWDAGR